jgi:hypothetical protein
LERKNKDESEGVQNGLMRGEESRDKKGMAHGVSIDFISISTTTTIEAINHHKKRKRKRKAKSFLC